MQPFQELAAICIPLCLSVIMPSLLSCTIKQIQHKTTTFSMVFVQLTYISEMSSIECLCSHGSSIDYSTVTLNFDLLTLKFIALTSVP